MTLFGINYICSCDEEEKVYNGVQFVFKLH
jgi:hypothetical protein